MEAKYILHIFKCFFMKRKLPKALSFAPRAGGAGYNRGGRGWLCHKPIQFEIRREIRFAGLVDDRQRNYVS